MRFLCTVTTLLGFTSISLATQDTSDPLTSLLEATQSFENLSQFRILVAYYPEVFHGLTGNVTGQSPKTILIPSDTAFEEYEHTKNATLTTLDKLILETLFSYHSLKGNWKSGDLQGPQSKSRGGFLSSTDLTDPEYDNRGLSSADGSGALPQVVVIQSGGDELARRRAATVQVRSGAGQIVNLTAVDGKWSGGTFQIVDG
jgi:Fasciclin domain